MRLNVVVCSYLFIFSYGVSTNCKGLFVVKSIEIENMRDNINSRLSAIGTYVDSYESDLEE